MGTITLPNFRVSGTDRARVRLKDGGVYVEWSRMTEIKAWLYSVEQKAISGRFDVQVDPQDGTRLLCVYSAQKPQYPGVNKLILQCKYEGAEKAYDKPMWSFVRWTADQAGEEITMEDPEVDVEIVAEDMSSSVLDEATAAALAAADKANEAAEQVPLEVLTQARQATQEAREATEEAEDAAEHATPYIGENGHWWKWDKASGAYVDTGEAAQGPTGNGIRSVEQTQSSQESEGENVVTVTMTDGTQAQFSIRNGKQGERGLQGVPGVANAKYKQVDTLPTASADTMDFIYLTPTQTAGVYDMSYTEQDGNTYTWKPLGTTAIQLADYATKTEVSQLRQEVTGDISQLEAEVDGVNETHYTEGGYINSSGTVTESDTYCYSEWIPCSPSVNYTIDYGTIPQNRFVVFYNSSKSKIDYWSLTTYNSTKTVTSPANSAYIRFSFLPSYNAKVFQGDTEIWKAKDFVLGLKERVQTLETKTETIETGVEGLNEKVGFVQVGTEQMNVPFLESGYFNQDGTIHSSETRGISAFLDVSQYNTIKTIDKAFSGDGKWPFCVFYASENADDIVGLISPSTTYYYPNNVTINIPNEARYARFNIADHTAISLELYKQSLEHTLDFLANPVNDYDSLPIVDSANPMRNIVRGMGAAGSIKEWGVVGASFESGTSECYNTHGGVVNLFRDNDMSWPQMFARMNGITMQNFTLPGNTIKMWCNATSSPYGWGDGTMGASKPENKKQAYIIVISGNDPWNKDCPIGDASTDIKEDYSENPDTFCGWLGGAIQRLRSVAPHCMIFVSNVRCGYAPGNTHDDDTQDYNDAIASVVAEFNDVFLLDIYRFGLKWYDKVVDSRYMSVNHPTPLGYLTLAYHYNTLIDSIMRTNQKQFALTAFINGSQEGDIDWSRR